MFNDSTIVKKERHIYTIADIVARFVRQKKFMPDKTYGYIYATKISGLSGDDIMLDTTEEILIALKRRKIISGLRMINLLGRHQRERQANN